MNNGKICIPVSGETVEEMIRQIPEAEKYADLIEVRFDYLDNPNETNLAEIFKHKSNTPWIATFRPGEQGGFRELNIETRTKFWNSEHETEFVDLEEDVVGVASDTRAVKICSLHDFSGVPGDIDALFDRLAATKAEIVKIAVNVKDATDAVPVWKLLARAKAMNKGVIPVAMGEAGKWTRILGLAHGAFLTYASLESGSETASGQLTAAEMLETFRVKDLDENTAVYGTIAGDTSYSASPYFQNAALKHEGINAVFIPLQVANIDEFMRRMVKPETREIELNFRGFAVTNPHKQSITNHLDTLDETAKKIGAVNTVRIEGGKFYGFNTDSIGFIKPLKNIYGDLRDARVAVVGAGGAARAVIHSLKEEKAAVMLFARNLKKVESLVGEFTIASQKMTIDHRQPTTDYSSFDILVNTTPLGTMGAHESKTIARAEQLNGVKLVYDLVYNPAETLLISEAKKVGIPTIGGLDMLITQGVAQFKIWTGIDAPIEQMRTAAIKRLFPNSI